MLTLPSRALSLTEPHILTQPTILVGYSMGGRAAMQLAHTYPDLVHAVVLISSNIGTDNPEPRHILEQSWLKKWESIGTDAFLRWWYTNPLFHTLDKERIVRMRAFNTLEKARKETELFSLANSPNYWKQPPKCPVHHYYGEYDAKYKNILKSVGHPIPEAAHAAHLENPQFVAQVLESAAPHLHPAQGIFFSNM